MNVYEARWNNAKVFFEKIKTVCDGDCFFTFDGEMFDANRIEINENEREIVLRDTNYSVVVYNGDTSCDDGAHTTIPDWNAEMRSRIKVFKEVEF